MSKIRIVAEIGCNHNGDVSLAKKLIDEAALAGVDAVKFQTFDSKSLVSSKAPLAEYQKKNSDEDTQLEMLKKLELSKEQYLSILNYCKSKGIKCFSTGFDFDSLDFLFSIGQNIWKIPSGEITDLPYLLKIKGFKSDNKKIILSTGMSTIDEIRQAAEIFEDDNAELTLLHCNTEYPTLPKDMNLMAINNLRDLFPKWNIGLSDHSEGNVAAVVAVGLGAVFIEKHFTLDKSLPGPDHKASITPDELRELCRSVRTAENMLGDSHKHVTDSEKKNKFVARKSIVAACNIKKGDLFNINNITCKRPGNGISPMHYFDLLGQVAERDFFSDELIVSSLFNWEETIK